MNKFSVRPLQLIVDYVDVDVITKFLRENADAFDWSYLSSNPSIPEVFFREHEEKIDRAAMCRNPQIPSSFLAEFKETAHLDILAGNPGVPWSFLEPIVESLSPGGWENLSSNPNVPLSLFEKNIEDVYWNRICENPNVPLSFFEKHTWGILEKGMWSKSHVLTSEFLEERLHQVDWSELCKNPNVPLSFFEKHLDGVDWGYLCMNPSVPLSFFQKILKEDEEQRSLQEEMRWRNRKSGQTQRGERNGKEPEKKSITSMPLKNCNRIQWKQLCMNSSIPLSPQGITFIKKAMDGFGHPQLRGIFWSGLSFNPNIPLEFIIENGGYKNVSWVYVSTYNTSLTAKFVEDHQDKIYMKFLSENTAFFRNAAREELLTLLGEIL